MKWLLATAFLLASVEWGQAHVVMASLIPRETEYFELECPYEGDLEYWLLHGKGEALYPTEELQRDELTVYANGSMIFESIKIEHAGIHTCVKKVGNSIYAHTVPLEVRPTPSTDLWGEVYQAKFITGLIAALVCFSLFALTCLVYTKRWRPVEKDSDVSPIIGNGYDNPAMIAGEEDSSSTKM
ncbi:uncharacterized protein [Palaemon carinicauda]|uniref:uncharacterized protein n=1 Tax=Palaemon carinicauda TaxID=392227 RepID=UPI0035B5726F